MSEEEIRKERATKLCRLVTEKIGQFAVPGLGHWDAAWDHVEDASGVFLDQLRVWEATGDPQDEERLEAAAKELIRTWWRVNEMFKDDKRTVVRGAQGARGGR